MESLRDVDFGIKVSGGNCGGETPVPIPNTEVKTARADGTWGVAPWESRSPPGFLKQSGGADGDPDETPAGRLISAGGVPEGAPLSDVALRPLGRSDLCDGS